MFVVNDMNIAGDVIVTAVEMLGEYVAPEWIDQLRIRLGLNDVAPSPVQPAMIASSITPGQSPQTNKRTADQITPKVFFQTSFTFYCDYSIIFYSKNNRLQRNESSQKLQNQKALSQWPHFFRRNNQLTDKYI